MGKGTLRGPGTPPSDDIGGFGSALIIVGVLFATGMIYSAYNNATKDMTPEAVQDRQCERLLRKVENEYRKLAHWEDIDAAVKYMHQAKGKINIVCVEQDDEQ